MKQAPLRGRTVWLAGAAAAAAFGACIVPDTGIVLTGDLNAAAVQILERAPVTVDLDCACDEASGINCDPEEPRETWNPNACPQPLASGLPHLMSRDLPQYTFCACPPGQFDNSPLPGVEILVNDLDVDEDGEPLDELFAALLVDADATADPTQAVGYLNYLNPNVPLSPFISEYQPIQQQRPKLRRVLIRDTTGTWDLCNGAGTPLTPGWHQVTLLTTDRPWFSVQDPIDPTAPPIVQLGVTDLAAGATQDQSHYVFHCYNGDDTVAGEIDPECESRCVGGGDDG